MEGVNEDRIEEALVEMAFRWGDVERALSGWTRRNYSDPEHPIPIGSDVQAAVMEAFRVEALVDEAVSDFGDDYQTFWYRILFDVEDASAREGATLVRKEDRFVRKVIAAEFGGPDMGSRFVSARRARPQRDKSVDEHGSRRRRSTLTSRTFQPRSLTQPCR